VSELVSLTRETYAGWHGNQPMRVWFERADLDLCLVEGRGARVRDVGGRWYLDARSGLWNVTLGYDHPMLVEAIERQLRTLPTGPLCRYERPPRVSVEFANALAARLPEGLGRIRLGSNGAQMTEGAVMLSRSVRVVEGTPERKQVVALEEAYHGAGPGAWALTDLPEYHDLYGPLWDGVHRAPGYAGDAEAALAGLEQVLHEAGPERITAVILEPVQGSRVVTPSVAYLRGVRELTARHGIHMIADEVATGMGRTRGVSLVVELGVVPDMLVLGKGLTSGYVPGTALAVSEEIYDLFYEGPVGFAHGATADGSTLAAAVGLAVLRVLFDQGLLEHAQRIGALLEQRLAELAGRVEPVVETGGLGLMHGVRLADPDGTPWSPERMRSLHDACAEAGMLIQTLFDRIVLVPPLVIDDRDCDQIVETVAAATAAVARESVPA
jgi:adenosylmethionine-8-amino-7-oxononanoate aminotransferase